MRIHKKKHVKIVLAGVGALMLAGGLTAYATHAYASGWSDHRDDHDSRSPRTSYMLDLFEKIDANGDKTIDQSELAAYRDGLFKRFDANSDKAINLDEFIKLYIAQTRPIIVRRFQALDENGDGKISVTEMNRKIDRIAFRLDDNGDNKIELSELRGGHRDHGDEHDDKEHDD